jgi:ATP-dependent protease ClpP protease subunit
MKRHLLMHAITAALAATSAAAPERPGIVAFNTLANGEAELLIYGFIGGWYEGVTAESIVDQLGAITATTINVRINSDGGAVTDGIAIYNALRRHGARKVVTIDGIAASIASLIAMAGDEIVMAANTLMMIHAPSGAEWGNAAAHREFADVLDTYATAMLESYARRVPAKRSQIDSILRSPKDTWFTAAQAVEYGLADRVLEDVVEEQSSDANAAAALLSYISAISAAPVSFETGLRHHIQAAARPSVFASLPEAAQRAVVAHIEDPAMRKQYENLITANAGGPTAAAVPAAPTPAAPAAAPAPAPAPVVAAAPTPAAPPPTDPIAALSTRNEQLRGVFATFRHISGVTALESDCLADPRMTIEAAQNRLLVHVGAAGQPLNGGYRVEAGADERDGERARIVDAMLARAGVITGAAAEAARQDNPFARATLLHIAEHTLIRAGINTRSLGRDEIAQRVLAMQGTSDFPVLMENVLNRMLIGGYNLQAFTWSRFCSVGTLSDYRPHNRYHLSSFSDLKEVNEHGEYENGVLGDAAKETIQGKRKGRILQLTPEVIVNDDLGGLQRIASALGQAAGRTIEKDVYALLALNAGLGPTMNDGKTLFHADHGNIAAVAAVPSVASFDASRQQMGNQKDPAGNDFLDITPAIWLGPLSLGGSARAVNAAEYDDDSQKNQRKPNISRGMYRDVVDSPRLSGTAWYSFADPNIEPVIEVAFLDGIREPRLEQETNFRTDGLSWKATHRYGTAGVGYRGATRNAGV